ncbi:hypothetical protein [Geodermatophilus sp. URMC 62]|uniref:hypothetical protein n=1 Tax=Geodermatophilus sp. URMC 62 TaxID=3423414 RepID=UPI00406C4189
MATHHRSCGRSSGRPSPILHAGGYPWGRLTTRGVAQAAALRELALRWNRSATIHDRASWGEATEMVAAAHVHVHAINDHQRREFVVC